MDSRLAQKEIQIAITKLRAVRDTLGETLNTSSDARKKNDTETRRLSELHARAARCIAAYHKD